LGHPPPLEDGTDSAGRLLRSLEAAPLDEVLVPLVVVAARGPVVVVVDDDAVGPVVTCPANTARNGTSKRIRTVRTVLERFMVAATPRSQNSLHVIPKGAIGVLT